MPQNMAQGLSLRQEALTKIEAAKAASQTEKEK